MSQSIYPVFENIKNNALVDNEQYQAMYQQSIDDPEAFWAEHGQRLDWITPYTKVKNTSFDKGHISIKWFEDGQLNASYNCIDRHLKDKADKTALIWEGDDPSQSEHISYQQVHDEVCKLANGLRKLGVQKGDRVAIYMPMTPQAVYAMQACARIGAVHSVVFGGFSPSAIADRIKDSGAKVVITSDEGRRGGNCVPLKANVDEAVSQAGVTTVEHVVVHQLTGGEVQWNDVDVWWHELVADLPSTCEPEVMDAEDPLLFFIPRARPGSPKGWYTPRGVTWFTVL